MAMKRANGDGSVYKLGGKRRKPWAARVTLGWNLDPNTGEVKQLYQLVGTFATRPEAETALNNFLQNPYDINAHKLTFADVYEKWSSEYYETLKNDSSARSYKAAFNHCKPIWDVRFRDLRVSHLEGVIKDADVGDPTKQRMKSMFNMMYAFAMRHEIADKDYSALFVHKIGKRDKSSRKPFSNSEVKKLWTVESFGVADLILVCIYSGWRPSEMLLLESCNVDLTRWRMKGGMKTEAGTDRVVPIHEKIRHIVARHYDPNFKYVFRNEKNEFMTYDQYRGRFKKVMRHLQMQHTPHEARHTFISCAKHFRMDDNLLKAIVGHKITDVTERVYTHRPYSDYEEAMGLIDYDQPDIVLDPVDAEWD